MRSTRVSVKRIVNNTIISLGGQLVTWSSTLVLTVAYGRFLGDVKFGELYFATTFTLLFGIPIERGFNTQLTRDIAKEPEKALPYLSNTILIKIVFWFVLYSFILLLSWLLGYTAEVRILVAISGVTLLFSSIASAYASLHYALERTVFPVVGTILEKGLSALFGFLFLRNGAGVLVMASILLGGSLISGIWQAIYFYRMVGTGFIIDRSVIRSLLRTSIPFLAYGMMGVLYYRLDVILLSLMTNNAVVGWYGAGYRLFDTLTFLPSIVIAAIMYPVFSKLSISSEENLKLATEKSLNFLLFFIFPTTVLIIVAAPNIIGFLYHRVEFDHTVPALQFLAPGLIFLYINTVLGALLVSIKQEKKTTMMAGVALIFNFGLNLFLIPHYQHVGAAIVTSLTELLFIGPFIAFMPRHLLPSGSLWVGIKIIVASLIMALAIWPLRVFNIFVILPVSIVVYLGSATLLRTIPRDDIKALYTAIRHKEKPTSSVNYQQEVKAEVEVEPVDAMLYTDEDTVPMKAIYGVMRYRAQRTSLASFDNQRGTADAGETLSSEEVTQQNENVHQRYDKVSDESYH